MSEKLLRITAVLAALAFANVACFNSYRISTGELEKLQSGMEAEEVQVYIDGCEGTAAVDTRVAQADGAVASGSSCEAVSVSLSNAISVYTEDGADYRVTPFNFTIGTTQLVAPDYDLLLSRQSIAGAEVEEFSTGKTVGLIVGGLVAIGGAFALISLLAPADRGLGG